MGSALPDVSPESFGQRLRGAAGPLDDGLLQDLFAHYLELRRWNPTLSLVGPGAGAEIVERHYAESLKALPLLPEGSGELLDLGSGAGFPGLILAAARRDFHVTLVEARAKKCAFLSAAARRMSLSVTCLNARVEGSLPTGTPDQIRALTSRALRLTPEMLNAIANRLTEDARCLFWAGEESPLLPPGFGNEIVLALPGVRRRILSAGRVS